MTSVKIPYRSRSRPPHLGCGCQLMQPRVCGDIPAQAKPFGEATSTDLSPTHHTSFDSTKTMCPHGTSLMTLQNLALLLGLSHPPECLSSCSVRCKLSGYFLFCLGIRQIKWVQAEGSIEKQWRERTFWIPSSAPVPGSSSCPVGSVRSLSSPRTSSPCHVQ